MDHEYWEEKLQGFLDRELEPADRAAVEDHIANCENCATQLSYFSAMKDRLSAHAESISMPPGVAQRLEKTFARKRNPLRALWVSGAGLALAAALIIAVFLPREFNPSYTIETDKLFSGKVVCHDCIVAERAELDPGALCHDGHRMGLEDEEGRLWRFASDEKGQSYLKNMALYGEEVRIRGQAIPDIGLIRIEQLERIIAQQAWLRF